MSLAFYLTYAARAMRRDGQRTLLALLCVAFGVMSVVSMQLLAGMINAAVNADPRASLGGDVVLRSESDRRQAPLTKEQIAGLDKLKSEGALSAYSLVAQSSSRFMRPQGTGHVYLLTNNPAGVDPASYPLVGAIHLREPQGTRFGDAISQPMNAVITSDIADKLGLHVGDTFTLVGDPVALPVLFHIAGVADSVPSARGDAIYYSLETEQRVTGQSIAATYAVGLWGSKGPAVEAVKSAGWSPYLPEEQAQNNSQASQLFGFMLKGAGILGLFVGGIGVANTLQVVLARRNLEIATLKTLGYRRRDLLFLFGIETGMLGILGGIFGVLAALAISFLLMTLLGHLGAFLLSFVVDPLIIAGGVLTGVLTAVIFGLYTIVRASSVRPAVLLREMPVKRGWGTRIAGAVLLLALLALFTAISMVVMGSLLDGAAVMAAALVGLLLLGLLLGGVLLAFLSLPTPGLPVLTMARRNLRRRPSRAIIALIALFAGVFAIGFAGAVILNAQERLVTRTLPQEGLNLTLYGKQSDKPAIEAELAKEGVGQFHTSTHIAAQVKVAGGEQLSDLSYMEARDKANPAWDIDISTGKADVTGDQVLVPVDIRKSFQEDASSFQYLQLVVGQKFVVTAAGVSREYTVAGTYSPKRNTFLASPTHGVIASAESTAAFTVPGSAVAYQARVDPDKLSATAGALGKALPQTGVLTLTDLNEAANRTFQGLFAFAVGLAGLALLAGAILIANAVGLAMVERRREIGILKAVGFTASRVLATLLVENALLGLLAGLAGMGGVGLAMIWINRQQPAANLALSPLLVTVMVFVSIFLSVLSAALVAWQPARVRPLEVLRNE